MYDVTGGQVSFFENSCPDLSTPFVEEVIFAQFYAPSPFVE